jgi:hypothetical protein
VAPRIVNIRQLKLQQFQPLLQAESHAWLEDLHWDYAPSAEMISAFLVEKRLSGYALLEEGIAKGYCLYFREGPKGMIGSLFTGPSDSGTDRACELLSITIEALFNFADVRRIEAQLPHFTVNQIGPHFRSRAFQTYLRQFMAFRLGINSANHPTTASQAGSEPQPTQGDFAFMPWDRRYDREAAHLLHHVYQNHIDAAVNNQYCTIAGTTRLVESIVRHRGCGDYLQQAFNCRRPSVHGQAGRDTGPHRRTAWNCPYPADRRGCRIPGHRTGYRNAPKCL